MSPSKPFPIVGIGASAGGIEALIALFQPMSADIRMAFVIVTHLAAGHESMLREILARHTALPVVDIEDGQRVEPGQVYVLPREAGLRIQQGTLHTTALPSGARAGNPIDGFFSSLAEDQGEWSIGIVLSGGGSDGTLGAKAIKECGGLTLAQGSNDTHPKHESMPLSADRRTAQVPLDPHDATIARLEREVSEYRDRLQATIEEYETAIEELRSANEELVSGNEEVQSTNEELESSKEELQSLNEEILTVNVELSRKVELLDEANCDLKNLFESTQIATVFLDRHLIIRNFTPAVTAVFNLVPSDFGRPLTDIVSRLDAVDMRRELHAALQSCQPVERRLTADDGARQYFMRLLPYRASDNSVDGLLATFIDITTVVEAEAHQRLLIAELNHRVRNMLAVVIGIATRTIAQTPELKPFSETFLGRLHALAGAYEPLSRVEWGQVELRQILAPQIEPHLKDPAQAKVVGPEIMLRPKAALALGLVFHELSINAAKYGALSDPDGSISIEWRQDDELLVLEWREAGGPPVEVPGRKGFGSELIERAVSYELDGESSVEFAPDGVKVMVKVPLVELLVPKLHGAAAWP